MDEFEAIEAGLPPLPPLPEPEKPEFTDIDYNHRTGVVIIEGVRYSMAEVMHVHKENARDLRAIHTVKDIFDGRILTGHRCFDNYNWDGGW